MRGPYAGPGIWSSKRVRLGRFRPGIWSLNCVHFSPLVAPKKSIRGRQKSAIPTVENSKISSQGRQAAAHPYTEHASESKVWVKLVCTCILEASLRDVLQASISMGPARHLCPPNKNSTAATALASCDYPLVVPSTNSAVTAPCSQKMGPYSGPVFGAAFRSRVTLFTNKLLQK